MMTPVCVGQLRRVGPHRMYVEERQRGLEEDEVFVVVCTDTQVCLYPNLCRVFTSEGIMHVTESEITKYTRVLE